MVASITLTYGKPRLESEQGEGQVNGGTYQLRYRGVAGTRAHMFPSKTGATSSGISLHYFHPFREAMRSIGS